MSDEPMATRVSDAELVSMEMTAARRGQAATLALIAEVRAARSAERIACCEFHRSGDGVYQACDAAGDPRLAGILLAAERLVRHSYEEVEETSDPGSLAYVKELGRLIWALGDALGIARARGDALRVVRSTEDIAAGARRSDGGDRG